MKNKFTLTREARPFANGQKNCGACVAYENLKLCKALGFDCHQEINKSLVWEAKVD